MSNCRTVRLVFPEWQGGYDETAYPGRAYTFGARLLAHLAPKSDAPVLEVPVPAWEEGMETPKDGGVFFRDVILRQQDAATSLLDAWAPERVITFGGDCLVSQAPFAWMHAHCPGKMGLVWIDAHPDISDPSHFDHSHAMVLGNLLGYGEPSMAAKVTKHFSPEQVAYVGVDNMFAYEKAFLEEHGLFRIGSDEAGKGSRALLDWVAAHGFTHLCVHVDLDVLDPAFFGSLLFRNPDVPNPIESEHGKLRLSHVATLLGDLEKSAFVSALTFAEYMPWDCINLHALLGGLDCMK